MNIGIIGTGGRSSAYTELCLSNIRSGVQISALADIDEDRLPKYCKRYFKEGEYPKLYNNSYSQK